MGTEFASTTVFVDEKDNNDDYDENTLGHQIDEDPSIIFKIIAVFWLMTFACCLYRMRRTDRLNREETARLRMLSRRVREEQERKRKDEFSVQRKKEIDEQIIIWKLIGPDGKKNFPPVGKIEDDTVTNDASGINLDDQQKNATSNDAPIPKKQAQSNQIPVSPNTTERHPKSSYTTDWDREETTCTICLDDLLSGEDLSWSKSSKCQHVFHSSCLTAWLMDAAHNDCPVCRTVLLPKHLEGGDGENRERNGRRDFGSEDRRVERRPAVRGAAGALDSLLFLFLDEASDDYFDDNFGDVDVDVTSSRTTNSVLDTLVSFVVPERFRNNIPSQNVGVDAPIAMEQEVEQEGSADIEMATFDTASGDALVERDNSNRNDSENSGDEEDVIAMGLGGGGDGVVNNSESDANNNRLKDIGRRKRKKDKKRYHSLNGDDGDNDDNL